MAGILAYPVAPAGPVPRVDAVAKQGSHAGEIAGRASGNRAVKARGTVSKQDYQAVIEPLVDAARRENRRIRLLYELGPEFWPPAAVREDATIGLASSKLF